MPVRHSAIPVRSNPSRSALRNPAFGITMPWTDVFRNKRQKHAKSVQRKTLYKTKYLTCKQSKTNKGKAVYPEAGAKKCKSQYKKWQKHRGKTGERALKLSDKLEKKGKLDPELEEALLQDIENSDMEMHADPDLTDAELAMMDLGSESDEESATLGGDNTMLYVGLGGLAVAGLLGVLLLKG